MLCIISAVLPLEALFHTHPKPHTHARARARARPPARARAHTHARSRSSAHTQTNMAARQKGKMRAVGRCAVYVLLWLVPCSLCSTLRLHRDHRFTLPQDRGFSLVSAFDELPERGAEQHSASQHRPRARRSTADSAVPKVYGRVRQVCLLIRARSGGGDEGFQHPPSIISQLNQWSWEIFNISNLSSPFSTAAVYWDLFVFL